MSAILSSEDLNDFISPGVACIKPVETLKLSSDPAENPYEVTTEDKLQAENAPSAQISLTDCLACSGCVTSAEAVLVSLQSHTEVANTLDQYPSLDIETLLARSPSSVNSPSIAEGKVFAASVSPQVRASLAAAYGISELKASYLIDQLLSGPHGLRSGGRHGSAFSYVVDTNRLREACLVLSADETIDPPISGTSPSKPILSSACPGWICYAEKTHPHILPHLSRLKSPQALTGVFLKSILCRKLNIQPSQIWHLAIMPCFDKKLEASREELTDQWWQSSPSTSIGPVRDVDCVITSRELLSLAFDRGISLPSLPLRPLPCSSLPKFPDPYLHSFLFPPRHRQRRAKSSFAIADQQYRHTSTPSQSNSQSIDAGTSGGYLYHVLKTHQSRHPGSIITATRGRNADVVVYTLTSPLKRSLHDRDADGDGGGEPQTLLKCARYYGFRNIQNLVRKLRPPRQSRLPGAATARTRRGIGDAAASGGATAADYAYIEVMACPGGCTNGGGQLKPEDGQGFGNQGLSLDQGLEDGTGRATGMTAVQTQREWLTRVDEAYYSAESGTESDSDDGGGQVIVSKELQLEDANAEPDDLLLINNISPTRIHAILRHWEELTGLSIGKLAYTEFRAVESDVGKNTMEQGGGGNTERVAKLAGKVGGGW